MDEYEAFEIVKKQLCREVIQIAEQIQKTNSMSVQDLDKLDKLFHVKKDMLTTKAMEEAEEYSMSEMSGNGSYANQNGGGNSGYRGRAANGRFVSRESRESYTEGYNRGYSEAMNDMGQSQANNGNSGHYPMMPYGPRRW